MRWIGRVLAAIAAALLLAVAVAVVFRWWVFPRPEFQEWLQGRVSAAVGEGVAFGAVSLAAWPAPGFRIHQLTLGGDSVTLDSLICVLSPTALFSGQVVVARVYLERPVLEVRRARDGRWVFGDPLQRILDRAAHGGGEPGPARSEPTMPRLIVREGSLDVVDEHVDGGPVELSIRDFTAEFEPPADGNPGRVHISVRDPDGARLRVDAFVGALEEHETMADARFEARVRGRSLSSDRALLYLLFGLPIRNAGGRFDIEGTVSRSASGAIEGRATLALTRGVVEGWGIELATPVQITAGFSVANGSFSLRGADLEAAGMGLDHYEAGVVRARFAWVDGELRMQKLEFQAYGGTWSGHGTVAFRAAPSYEGGFGAADVDLRRLASAISGSEVADGFETLDGEATLRGHWSDAKTWPEEIAGVGSVRLADGSFESSPIFSGVLRGLARAIPGFSRLARDGGRKAATRLDHLAAAFTLEDGRAHSENVVIVTNQYELWGAGSLGVDGSVEIAGAVALTSGGISQLYSLASAPFTRKGSESLPRVPVRVAGTLSDLRVTPDLTDLSLAPFRTLFASGRGAAGLVRDAAVPPARLLKSGFERVLGKKRRDGEATEETPAPTRTRSRSLE